MENRNEKEQSFVKMRAKGNSFDRISKILKVSKGTLIKWSKQYKQEVSNMLAIEKDARVERYKISHIHQLETYGKQLLRVREELSKRNLDSIHTDKLINLEIKLLEAVNNLNTETFLTDGEDWDKLIGVEQWSA